MQADKTTITDLSIFHSRRRTISFSPVKFYHLVGGKEWFHHFLRKPFSDLNKIEQTQQTTSINYCITRASGHPLLPMAQ